MDRKDFNQYGAPRMPARAGLKQAAEKTMHHPPVILDEWQRPVVENSIREVCAYRGYELYAVQVRTNHVHIVVAAAGKPEPVMNAFKAYATRHLREKGLISTDAKLWVRHGSTRYLWTPRHIELAVDYVINGQGDELPSFE
jgi:REP element-mobilizing transposase RayT